MKHLTKRNLVNFGLLTVVFGAFGLMFVPFITPLLMAVIFAFALDPMVSRYPFKRSRNLPIILFLMIFYFVIITPIGVVASRLISKVKGYSIANLQHSPLFQNLERHIQSYVKPLTKAGVLEKGGALENKASMLSEAAAWCFGYVTDIITEFPVFALEVFVFSAALYFFLTESKNIKASLCRLQLCKDEQLNQLILVLQRSCYMTLVTTAVIGAVQAGVVSIFAWFFGFEEILVIFLVTLVVSFIPIIGAAPVAFVLSMVGFLQEDLTVGIGMLVASLIAGSIDNVLKPFLVNNHTEGLHPVVSLLAIIGGVIVYGLPGLLLGPVLTDLAFQIIPILFDEPETLS